MRRRIPVKAAAAVLSAVMVMSGVPALAAEPDAQSAAVMEVSEADEAVVTLDASSLDPANLEDGVYSVNVEMINASNPNQKSMSDAAITKPVMVTVKNGAYSVTANFHGIYINLAGQSFFGYMKELSYWDGSAYAPVTVNSTYDVTDDFNDANGDGVADYNYPHQMTFPLVNKNLGDDEDGFVHVRVFVPIMESISAGSGTQQALMKIDWSSLEKGDAAAKEAMAAEELRNKLNETASQAKTINTAGYTDASVQALNQAITEAEALLKNNDASKAQFEAALTKLNTAVSGLTKKTVAKNQWMKSGSRWWYRHADGTYTRNNWEKIGGKWYYFDKDGWMVTGWQKISGKWYYFNTSGAMVSGWQKISGKWYYFNAGGAMVSGWQKISGKWYYFNASGAMVTGWQKISGKWYYFNASGAMLTGTQTIGGKTYRFDSNGVWKS